MEKEHFPVLLKCLKGAQPGKRTSKHMNIFLNVGLEYPWAPSLRPPGLCTLYLFCVSEQTGGSYRVRLSGAFEGLLLMVSCFLPIRIPGSSKYYNRRHRDRRSLLDFAIATIVIKNYWDCSALLFSSDVSRYGEIITVRHQVAQQTYIDFHETGGGTKTISMQIKRQS